VPLQILLGDMHGLNTFHHQPAKVAGMEGHWETRAGAPLILFGWPDQGAETTRWAVEVPYLGSLILTHSLDGTVRGLKMARCAASRSGRRRTGRRPRLFSGRSGSWSASVS